VRSLLGPDGGRTGCPTGARRGLDGGSILLNFFKIVKFVGCTKFMLNLIKLNEHSYMTINVIKFFF
jgi:hypothetical protein